MALVIATPILSGLHHHYARGSNFRERQVTSIASSGVKSRPSCRCKHLPSMNW